MELQSDNNSVVGHAPNCDAGLSRTWSRGSTSRSFSFKLKACAYGSATMAVTAYQEDTGGGNIHAHGTRTSWGITVPEPPDPTTPPEPPDPPKPTVSIVLADPSNPAVDEGTALRFLVTRDLSQSSRLTVGIDVAESPSRGAYLTQPVQGSVTIPAHATSAVLRLTTVQDQVDEPNGSVTVTIKPSAAYNVSATNGAATIDVRDDDELPHLPLGLEANGNIVRNQVVLWWERASHATDYEVRYSPEVCTDHGETTTCAPDSTAWEGTTVSGQARTFLKLGVDNDLDKKTLYRVEVRGVSPVGTSRWSDHTFVYPTDGPPTVSGQFPPPAEPPYIASAPLYGHQKDGVWRYSICDGTIPSTFTRIGASDLENAVNKWSTAVAEDRNGGQLLTATRVYPADPPCRPPLLFYDIDGRDEIMFTSKDRLILVGCLDTVACWRTNTWHKVFHDSTIGWMHGLPKIKPGFIFLDNNVASWESPSYNRSPCAWVENIVVHEAGHAFGVGWPLASPWDDQFLNKHPENTRDAVMSYESKRYCEPQAYDVAAMRVNYQSR